MTSKQCWVCSDLFVKGCYHEHHVHPQHLGGRDKATRVLCPNCHTCVHELTRRLGRSREAARELLDMYSSRLSQQKLVELARMEMQAHESSTHELFRVMLEFSAAEYDVLKDAVKRSKSSSIVKYCKTLLLGKSKVDMRERMRRVKSRL